MPRFFAPFPSLLLPRHDSDASELLPPQREAWIVPRYKFHIYNDDQTIDEQGQVCPDLATARRHAIAGARGIMAESIKARGEITLGHWIEVEDEQGDMHVVPFADAVKVNP